MMISQLLLFSLRPVDDSALMMVLTSSTNNNNNDNNNNNTNIIIIIIIIINSIIIECIDCIGEFLQDLFLPVTAITFRFMLLQIEVKSNEYKRLELDHLITQYRNHIGNILQNFILCKSTYQ